ncbi:MAG: hypothetical protein U0031_02935 [Thermomicrobiales bacterium]
MPDPATPVYPLFRLRPGAAQARFDGGRLTGDGGLPWLEQAERSGCARVRRGDPRLAARSSAP